MELVWTRNSQNVRDSSLSPRQIASWIVPCLAALILLMQSEYTLSSESGTHPCVNFNINLFTRDWDSDNYMFPCMHGNIRVNLSDYISMNWVAKQSYTSREEYIRSINPLLPNYGSIFQQSVWPLSISFFKKKLKVERCLSG